MNWGTVDIKAEDLFLEATVTEKKSLILDGPIDRKSEF